MNPLCLNYICITFSVILCSLKFSFLSLIIIITIFFFWCCFCVGSLFTLFQLMSGFFCWSTYLQKFHTDNTLTILQGKQIFFYYPGVVDANESPYELPFSLSPSTEIDHCVVTQNSIPLILTSFNNGLFPVFMAIMCVSLLSLIFLAFP